MKSQVPILLLCISLWTSLTTQAQVTPAIKEKYTPYELMSSYYDDTFNPFKKGNVYTGFAFSLTDKRLTNSNYFFDHVVDGDQLDYDLILKAGYYTGPNGMAGVTFNYTHSAFTGTLLKSNGVVISSSDTVQSSSVTNGFAISPYFRPSLPITANDRLSFFTEVSVTFGGSHKNATDTNKKNQVETTMSRDFNFKVGLSPGITFFALENFALEAQMDLLGYSLDVSKKTVNGADEAIKSRQNVNFNINILSLNLGLAYYFGAKHQRD